MRKASMGFALLIASMLYVAFVAMCYWRWFVVAALHVAPIAYVPMLGLVFFVLLIARMFNLETESSIENLAVALRFATPPGQRDEARKAVNKHTLDLGSHLMSLAVWNTMFLAIGFVIHLFV